MREALRTLREYWALILTVTVVAGAATLLHASRLKGTYEATARVAFQNLTTRTQDLDVFGTPTVTSVLARHEALSSALTVTRPEVMRRVQRRLASGRSIEALTSATRVEAPPRTGTLLIHTRSGDRRFAASLADAIAAEVVARYNRRLRARVLATRRTARQEMSRLRRSAPRELRPFYGLQIDRLRSLARSGPIPQVRAPAPAVVRLVSRSPLQTAALGSVFGLLAAILTAFVARSVDRRLRTAGEVQEKYGLPVLGELTGESLGGVVRLGDHSARNAGGDADRVRRIRGNLEALRRQTPMRSLLITSQFAGEGKSTVAASLALALAGAGRRTLLLECDLRRPVLAARLGIGPTPGLTEVMLGELPVDEALHPVPVDGPLDPGDTAAEDLRPDDTSSRLDCLPAGGTTPAAAELLASARFEQLLADLERSYDTVLLDGTPLLSIADSLELVSKVDAVLLCARVGETTRNGVTATLEAIGRFPPRPMALVITGVRPRDATGGMRASHHRLRRYRLRSA